MRQRLYAFLCSVRCPLDRRYTVMAYLNNRVLLRLPWHPCLLYDHDRDVYYWNRTQRWR